MTRIQRARFASEEEYLAQKNVYVLDKQKMKNARKLMALILGVIMAMGCLSVSAANKGLTVTEKAAKMMIPVLPNILNRILNSLLATGSRACS